MPEIKHTPGPWVIGPYGVSGGIGIDAADPADGKKFEVCEVWGVDLNTEHDERSRANAKLIAAAPNLLEALQDLVTELGDDWNMLHNYLDRARAAIAKATE